jgi:hypothetical protein
MSLTVLGRSRRLARALLAWARGRLALGCLPPVGDRRVDDRLHALVRQVLRLCSGFNGEGMLDNHHRVLGQSQGLSPDACRLGEGVCNDGDGGAASLFGFDAVVETPRGAGPSIGHRMDDGVAFAGQLVQNLIGRRHILADFPVRDDVRHTIPVLQQLAQRLEIHVGVPFVVVDEPHSPALQAGQAGCQALGLGHIFGGRM